MLCWLYKVELRVYENIPSREPKISAIKYQNSLTNLNFHRHEHHIAIIPSNL